MWRRRADQNNRPSENKAPALWRGIASPPDEPALSSELPARLWRHDRWIPWQHPFLQPVESRSLPAAVLSGNGYLPSPITATPRDGTLKVVSSLSQVENRILLGRVLAFLVPLWRISQGRCASVALILALQPRKVGLRSQAETRTLGYAEQPDTQDFNFRYKLFATPAGFRI